MGRMGDAWFWEGGLRRGEGQGIWADEWQNLHELGQKNLALIQGLKLDFCENRGLSNSSIQKILGI